MVTVYVVNHVIGTKNSDAFIEVMQLWKVQLWRFDCTYIHQVVSSRQGIDAPRIL